MKAGASRVEITPVLSEPLPLLGWGDPNHFAESVATPIHSRTVALEDAKGNRLVFVCVEICFISESIRLGVMKELTSLEHRYHFNESEVVLTATHTHNAPGGYCHSILYNIPSKGYRPEIFETYVTGIVKSIREAWDCRKACTLRSGSIEIPLHEEVAFNRSLSAYNRNSDVEPVPGSQSGRAVYRVMDGLAAFDETGTLIAYINWFAVHCTSMHRDFPAIHSDHKGLASLLLEKELKTVVLFAQGAAGDVSPNFKRYWFLREMRGRFRDDERSALFNAEIQANYARKLLHDAKELPALNAGQEEIDSILAYHDCTSIPIPKEWIGGRMGVSTGPAALGCPFMAGTAEGVGAPRLLVFLTEWILRGVYFFKGRKLQHPVHGKKVICVELSEARVFGDARPEDLPIPVGLTL